jgi:serine/threonine-protein kinase
VTPLPHRFGSYVLFDRIGQGGMAELFLARNASGKLLVVKLILPVYAERPEFAKMLADEAKLAAALSHANIVQVVDLGKEQDRLFIAMEYVEGFDLSALLKRCSKEKVPLPPEFAMYAVVELLAALDYAHKKSVVHRDVSPSNVLVSFAGEVKLCDFGIARANVMATPEGEQPSEAIKGKAGYMSPEHARGDVIDGRADVFAAGIIAWELLAGKKLYRASAEAGDLIEQARAAKIPELGSRGLPDEPKLHAIVARALAPSRDDRYATAGEMRRDLLDWITAAKLGASAIRFGDWLAEHFGQELLATRNAREAAAKALDPSPKPARALVTPTPETRITYKEDEDDESDDEPLPESLSPMDTSPSSRRPNVEPENEKDKPTPWGVIIAGVVVAGVVAWLLSR